MKRCVLLDAYENRAKPVGVPKGKKLLQTAYDLIGCDTVQLVPIYPDRLPKGFEALCDEDVHGKPRMINALASWIYGCDDHATPILNNVVIFKTKVDDLTWMTEEEAQQIADDLNGRADEILRLIMGRLTV